MANVSDVPKKTINFEIELELAINGID